MKKTFQELMQYFLTSILKTIAKVFWIMPIKENRVIFTSFSGKQFSCNPKYISEYLRKHYDDEFDIVWVLRNKKTIEQSNYTTVRFLSIAHFFYFCTAKVIVDNGGMPTYMPKRQGQYMINTWHGGGAYKLITLEATHASAFRKKLEINKARDTDLVLSSSAFFSNSIVPDIVYGFTGEVMPSGMPRNDLLINGLKEQDNLRIKKQLRIDEDALVVLYAPTYRGNFNAFNGKGSQVVNISIDFEVIRRALQRLTNRKVTCLFRAHHALKTNIPLTNVIDASNYPDMQELLCISDILISDYSSCIWDYSLTKKPCFLFCPDMDYYLYADKGVCTPIETWPGILCCSNEELEQEIMNFNQEEYVKKVEKHHMDLGSYEKGTACKQVCGRIRRICQNRK